MSCRWPSDHKVELEAWLLLGQAQLRESDQLRLVRQLVQRARVLQRQDTITQLYI